MKYIYKNTLILLLLFSVGGLFAQESYSSFPVDVFVGKIKGPEQVFVLEEQEYIGGFPIVYINKKKKNNSTVEGAAISRFSSISNLDIEWWKDEWFSPKEAFESLEVFKRAGATEKDILESWNNIANFNQIFLTELITYQDLKIVMYKVQPKNRQLKKDFTVPIVFKENTSGWKVASDLSHSPLMQFRPWISGEYTIRQESLWVL